MSHCKLQTAGDEAIVAAIMGLYTSISMIEGRGPGRASPAASRRARSLRSIPAETPATGTGHDRHQHVGIVEIDQRIVGGRVVLV